MDAKATAVFLRFFSGLRDPRRPNVRHLFTDIFTIAILGVMCKADDWIEVVAWAKANGVWLSTFLSLPHGIPSSDTFRRVFMRIDPEAFESCFVAWTTALAEKSLGRLIAIDGKSLRRSFEHAWDKSGMTHMVSAWCGHNEMVLAQLATADKSNEITAIPKLLELLDLKGAIVTIDAIGCQTEIAAGIVEKGGDYVLAVKDNQPTLNTKLRRLLDEAILDGFAGMSHDYFEQTNGGHGRIETRKTWVTDEVHWLGPDLLSQWPSLSSLAVVESHRRDLSDRTGKVTVHRRYYIASLEGCNAPRVAGAVREHWGVENQLHWRLDMTFGEDDSRLSRQHGAENFSRLRRLVMNQLRPVQGKMSLKTTRYLCSIDRDFLLNAIQQ